MNKIVVKSLMGQNGESLGAYVDYGDFCKMQSEYETQIEELKGQIEELKEHRDRLIQNNLKLAEDNLYFQLYYTN